MFTLQTIIIISFKQANIATNKPHVRLPVAQMFTIKDYAQSKKMNNNVSC